MTPAVPYAEVVGDPIAHSKSPLIHRFWLEKLGIEGKYCAVQVAQDGLAAYLAERRGDPLWRGCNLTMPLKLAVLPLADEQSADVRQAGAANCLVREDAGRLRAFNFDVEGVARPLRRREATEPGARIQIIGSGGAAKAAALGILRAGFDAFDIFTRNMEAGAALLAALGTPSCRLHPLTSLGPDRTKQPHVIVNATPMGMRGRDPLPIDLSAYDRRTVVFDMVYEPLETDLLRQARQLGMRTIDGLEMLIEQAGHAFRRFFGAEAPRPFDGELRELLAR